MAIGSDQTPGAAPALLDLAVSIAREAGELTLGYFGSKSLDVERKGDGSPVTDADRRAEQLARDRILAAYPDDSIIGEEFDDVSGSSGRTWVIDPIDGTHSFVCGVPLYATLIAVIDEHGPAIGAVNIPALGELVAAGRGLGATFNGEPTTVGTTRDVAKSTVTTSGFDYLSEESSLAIRDTGASFRTWGDGYGYVLVATGRVDAMVDAPGLSLWDVAPMNVVIPEAGGTITSWSGVPLPQGGATLASNGHVHQDLLDVLEPTLPGASHAKPTEAIRTEGT